MGAGKTTIGKKVARAAERAFVDLDEEIEKRHGPIARIFEERGEPEFRRIEEKLAAETLSNQEPCVVALGAGAASSGTTREQLRTRAFTVWIEVAVNRAWGRVRGGDRPLARDEGSFRRLFEERQTLYLETRDAAARDADDVLLQALEIVVRREALSDFSDRRLYLGDHGPVTLIADERVLELHPIELDAQVQRVPPGEQAKRLALVARLVEELDLDRSGTVVAFGGGCVTDLAGFVAATYLRGVRWIAVPTTLVGQVDAGIGGKTGVDLEKGKNLVGAFHYPAHVVADPDVLSTLPEREQKNGMAEVVKTGLLAGRPAWDLPEDEMVRSCAAFKAGICLSDPYEQTGRRSILNLGHTFAHGLEAASDYNLPHGEAVALGLLATLRLSGMETDVVDAVLQPKSVRVDAERAWIAMRHDKKARDGRIRLVLLEGPGKPVFPIELSDTEVRRELERLIAK
jgi:shikimate kinase / 3-dehydroquinate synthase